MVNKERIELTEKTTAAQLHNTLVTKGNKLLTSTMNAIQNDS
jgi:methionyl-tRNA formyltransferase